MARGVADREEHRLVLGARFRERLLRPRIPVDRVVRVLQQVGRCFLREPIHGRIICLFRAQGAYMRYGVAAVVLFLSALPAFSATLTWTGNVGSLWSDAGNWSPAVEPANGDALVFPASAATFDTVAYAVTLSSMSFDTAYTVSSGDVIALSGGITINGGSQTVAIEAPVRLAGTNSWTLGTNALTVQSLDTNGQTLNAQGSGGVLDIRDTSGAGPANAHGVTLRLTGGSFSGTVNTDTLEIDQAQLSSATIVAQSVRGNGVVKSL